MSTPVHVFSEVVKNVHETSIHFLKNFFEGDTRAQFFFMGEELSDYEKQRLANIARNQGVLEQLGLADKKKPADSAVAKPKQPKPNVPPAQSAQPSRVMPRRGQGIQNYNEYFAQQYDALDELEKEEKDRIKHERKADKRQVRPVQYYDDTDYDSSRPARPRKKRHISDNHAVLPGDLASRPPRMNHPVVEDDKISEKQYAKLFAFRFTPTQLHDATFSDEAVNAFQLYCDERAHIRYQTLTVNHNEKDIIEVAKAISDNSDTSSLDAALVKDYSDAIQCFVCNSDKLAPPMSYKSINPKVYCSGCNNIFAYTDAGTIRAHSGCATKR